MQINGGAKYGLLRLLRACVSTWNKQTDCKRPTKLRFRGNSTLSFASKDRMRNCGNQNQCVAIEVSGFVKKS